MYAWLRPSWPHFWAAKGYALLIAPVLIVSIFYTYTALVGRNLLVLDIATFITAIAAGQIGSAMLFSASRWTCYAISVGTMLLICQVIAYSTLTFYPLPFSIFKDSHDGGAGAAVLLKHEI